MSAPREQAEFRRILVALDASKESLAALTAAANLAAQLQAELAGLFIEDIDLLNLAALPFSREARMLSSAGRGLEPERLERELKSRAALARRTLAQVAEALHLHWTFRVARGRIETELLAAAAEADMVAVGKGTRPMSGEARLGRTGRAVASLAPRSVLFASTIGCPADAPMGVVYDANAGADSALALAARLAEREGRRLLVFVLGGDRSVLVAREMAVAERLRSLGARAILRPVRGTGLGDMLRVLQAEPVGTLVIGSRDPAGDESAALDLLIERSACSVLIVRA